MSATVKPADETPFHPSNGTEGCIFMSDWCSECRKQGDVEEPDCDILVKTFMGPVPEWQYQGGKPTCTAFEKLPVLGIDGEPLPEPDPRQLRIEVDA